MSGMELCADCREQPRSGNSYCRSCGNRRSLSYSHRRLLSPKWAAFVHEAMGGRSNREMARSVDIHPKNFSWFRMGWVPSRAVVERLEPVFGPGVWDASGYSSLDPWLAYFLVWLMERGAL